jgi:hypothetical protein
MVSVLAIGPKFRGLKPGRGDRILRAIKIRNTPSFGGQLKPPSPSRKLLRHVENHFEVRTKILRRLNSSFLSPGSCFATIQLFW